MAYFNLTRDKLIIVAGVVTSFKAGSHEITNEDVIKSLRGAKDCVEIIKKTKVKAAE